MTRRVKEDHLASPLAHIRLTPRSMRASTIRLPPMSARPGRRRMLLRYKQGTHDRMEGEATLECSRRIPILQHQPRRLV